MVAVYVLTQLASIGWDLPCMYGWENDSVAPRDLFGGLAINLTPGQGHRYPLFHYVLLAFVAWPPVVLAVWDVPSWTLSALMERVLRPETLTGIALSGKLLSVAMGAITVLVLGRIVRRTFDVTAARWAIAFAAVNLTVSYYGRVTNLDGPYLMWTALAAHALLDVAERGTNVDYGRLGFFVGASIATKDQAYASYVLTLPLFLVVLPLLRVGPFEGRTPTIRPLAIGAGVGALTLGLLGGGLLNPTGFVHRLSLLTGTNSEDWRVYPRTFDGLLANLGDLASHQPEFFWPWPIVLLGWIGVAIAFARPGKGALEGRLARAIPAVLALSSVAFFTLVVGRCEHRFVLPLGLWLSGYAGVAAAQVIDVLRWRRMGAIVVTAAWLLGFQQSLALHLTQWGDARREVEGWLAALPRGSTVEVYGSGVYLPRLDLRLSSPYRARRVASDDPRKRPPIPGLIEVEGALRDIGVRRSDVLVMPEGHVERFLDERTDDGMVASAVRRAFQRDEDATRFFREALDGRLAGYTLALHARPRLPAWAEAIGMRPLEVHGSTGRSVWVLERRPDDPRPAPSAPVADDAAF